MSNWELIRFKTEVELWDRRWFKTKEFTKFLWRKAFLCEDGSIFMNWIKVADNMPEELMLDVPYPWEDCKVLLNKKWVKGKFLSFKDTDERRHQLYLIELDTWQKVATPFVNFASEDFII